MTDAIKVDIWSDIACPWCYIGKRKFETGLAEFAATDDTPVEVTYHSFELAPDTPEHFHGTEIDFLAEHKGMPKEQVTGMLDQVTGIAATVGLDYNFDILQHANTRLAHEALHFAKAQGRQREFKERLLKAYFTEGRQLGDAANLVELGGEIGLDSTELAAALADRRYRADVDADIAQAQAYGINGVPFFVFQGKYGVSGAQEAAAFAQVLGQVAQDETEATA